MDIRSQNVWKLPFRDTWGVILLEMNQVTYDNQGIAYKNELFVNRSKSSDILHVSSRKITSIDTFTAVIAIQWKPQNLPTALPLLERERKLGLRVYYARHSTFPLIIANATLISFEII